MLWGHWGHVWWCTGGICWGHWGRIEGMCLRVLSAFEVASRRWVKDALEGTFEGIWGHAWRHVWRCIGGMPLMNVRHHQFINNDQGNNERIIECVFNSVLLLNRASGLPFWATWHHFSRIFWDVKLFFVSQPPPPLLDPCPEVQSYHPLAF